MESLYLLSVVVVCCLLQQIRAESIYCPGIPDRFTDDQPYDGLPLPECPEAQGIVMKVYTRDNPNDGQLITRNSTPSVFKGNSLTLWIVHGWLQNENYEWMHTMKDETLKQGDYNVVIVGWSKGALRLWYPQSASNTRTVGAEIALASNFTIANGNSSRSRQYCVGHSLGGHVCGHAGKYGQFGRITGLDPAGPWFEDRDWTAGLNPSCADFVDVIHTNGRRPWMFGLGMMKALGHVDFYPNGGSKQPGCFIDPFSGIINPLGIFTSDNNTLKIGLEVTLGCSHIRAYEFFTESIRTPCFLSRDVCTSQNFLGIFSLDCKSKGEVVQSFSFAANDYLATGLFYLKTNPSSPFCRN